MTALLGLIAANPEIYLAAQKTATKTQATSTWIMWALIAVMLGVFYFILIRPQRKRSQQHEQMISKIERGDEVVTIGGMHGTIKRLDDDTVVLEVAEGVTITFSRSAIARGLTVHQEEEEVEVEEEEPEELEDELEEELEEESDEEVAEEAPEEPEGKGKK